MTCVCFDLHTSSFMHPSQTSDGTTEDICLRCHALKCKQARSFLHCVRYCGLSKYTTAAGSAVTFWHVSATVNFGKNEAVCTGAVSDFGLRHHNNNMIEIKTIIHHIQVCSHVFMCRACSQPSLKAKVTLSLSCQGDKVRVCV